MKLSTTLALKRIFASIIAMVQVFVLSNNLFLDIGGIHKLRGDMAYDFAYSSEKIAARDILGYDKDFDLYMAKNEYEACQLTLRNRYHSIAVVNLNIGEFQDKNGNVLEKDLYKVMRTTSYTNAANAVVCEDGLLEYDGRQITLQEKLNASIFIQVKTTKDTPAGEYVAPVTMVSTCVGNEEEFETEIRVHVWDFTLPEDPIMDTAFGINATNVAIAHNVERNSPESAALYKKYYDFLLDRGISAYDLPYDILDERANEYMSNPRVTSFKIPYPGDDALLVEYYNKIQSNEVWAEKAFFYPVDEPNQARLPSYLAAIERLERLCPGFHIVTPLGYNEVELNGETMSILEATARTDIMCPISNLIDRQENGNDILEQRVNDLGYKHWWYVCCAPDGDYCNFFQQYDGIRYRELFWQQKQNNVTGLLYWNTTYWSKVDYNPWSNGNTWNSTSLGDGSLLNPSYTYGLDEPMPTLRITNITDGIEDYTYIAMAEELFGTDYVDKAISKITTNLTEYNMDRDTLESVRNAIGEDLADAMN